MDVWLPGVCPQQELVAKSKMNALCGNETWQLKMIYKHRFQWENYLRREDSPLPRLIAGGYLWKITIFLSYVALPEATKDNL